MKTHCPMCGVPTSGNVENESLVVDGNIVCKDPVCRQNAIQWLRRGETQLQLQLVREPQLNLPYFGDP